MYDRYLDQTRKKYRNSIDFETGLYDIKETLI